MLFNSLTFLVFFVAVLSAGALLSSWPQRKGMLLIASYVFYGAWYAPYVLILLFSTTLDWWLARRMFFGAVSMRRRWLLFSLAGNLGLLGFFKYGGFALDNLTALLRAAGIAYEPAAWDILLPVGISFYTFASLSYTIDVYCGRIRGDAPFLDYALFVSFFPHLVAGPIVRAEFLLPQFATPRRASRDQLGWGLALTAMGLFCKVAMADAIFAPVVDAVHANPRAFGAVDAWAAVLGFSGQIYYDFAGYSLCAIGLALCFGIEFPDNFRYPYAARGPSDFWRRWHVSLSSWLRDYLYIPLGGNRGGNARTCRNLMLTMLIGGLWHGASWMFVLWGGLHGLYLVAERLWRGARLPDAAAIAATFLLVTLTWIPFRTADMGALIDLLGALARVPGQARLSAPAACMCLAAMAVTVAWQFRMRRRDLGTEFARLAPAARAGVVALCLVGIFVCSGGDQRAFIYFQF